jgi:putative membrane protein
LREVCTAEKIAGYFRGAVTCRDPYNGRSMAAAGHGERTMNPLNENLSPPNDPRTWLAAERTLLAWIRTGLAMMGFGFVVARFGLFLRELAEAGTRPVYTRSTGASFLIGTALILLGVVANLVAAYQYQRLMASLRRNEFPTQPRWSLALVATLLLAVIGVAMAGYLFALHQA